ncbi:uncharacterized protein LOC131670584 [Phymastichus coffea]|uniref:uncharacterized protein LOC131670584 n=1 Tax=Phymastichus coffea TaxID=108790 RepID=UPI00273C07B4|nr:uncharacterized protein LOC131670584 [Phymastichus coffea]
MVHDFLTNYSPWLDMLIWNLNIPLQLRLRENKKNDFVERGHKVNETVLLTYMILIWTILYSIYKKCLNVHLRNLGYAFIRRNRISNTIWTCGLNTVIILYTVFLWDTILKPELNVIMLKSLYIHYTGIIILINKSWLKGFSNAMLILFVFGISRSSLKSPVTSIFLLTTIDVLILDICKIMYLKWPQKLHQTYTKTLYIIYCLLWTYLYMVHVPINLLLPYKYQFIHEQLYLWLWFITQYFSFVLLDLIRNFTSSRLLELCLFPNPSTESIHLRKIFNSYKEMKNSTGKESVAAKKELWQTLMCAMTMKKKLNRLRKSKQAKEKNLFEQENLNNKSK